MVYNKETGGSDPKAAAAKRFCSECEYFLENTRFIWRAGNSKKDLCEENYGNGRSTTGKKKKKSDSGSCSIFLRCIMLGA